MKIGAFTIGEAFPASDPVARFVTVLAMMSNDGHRLLEAMAAVPEDDDEHGLRVLLFRHQAALYFEAAEFIRDTPKQFPKIETFLAGLDDEAKDAREAVVGSIDPRSGHYIGAWIEPHRNVTFHYPEMHPDKATHGKEEITNALARAANKQGTITHRHALASLRFGFADDVAVEWLPNSEDPTHLIQLREALRTLLLFVERTATAYVTALPAGTIAVTTE